MGFLTIRTSDLSGTQAEESDLAQLVIRDHPALEEPKVLDVLPQEVKGLKTNGNFVTVELKLPDDTVKELVIPYDDFKKIVPDAVLSKGRSTRGRRPGYKPNGN